jgi:NAD(P)-dependent dehydrogenase (short-subunit alcohol dehydrogenase family)
MKSILLTGSSGGFGLQAVKTLAAKGHTLYATMRNIKSSNAAVAKELEQWAIDNNTNVNVVELDVTSNESVKSAIAQISEKSGGIIDVLINNAGASFLGAAESLTIEQTDYLYQVNTIGPERTMKAVIPYMRNQKEGLIINVSSVQSLNLIPMITNYNGTKAALDAVSAGYHYELKSSGIDVVIIQPGGYQTTDIITKSLKAENDQVEQYYGADIMNFKKALQKYFLPTDKSRNPKEVADLMLALVELPLGERPLWNVVGGAAKTEIYEKINHMKKEMIESSLDVLPKIYLS